MNLHDLRGRCLTYAGKGAAQHIGIVQLSLSAACKAVCQSAIQPQGGGKDVFVHISAVERAGLSTLNEGASVEYEVVANRGKESAENLKVR
jgi:CspA family cold shock protein